MKLCAFNYEFLEYNEAHIGIACISIACRLLKFNDVQIMEWMCNIYQMSYDILNEFSDKIEGFYWAFKSLFPTELNLFTYDSAKLPLME